jgi:hypothetical protein
MKIFQQGLAFDGKLFEKRTFNILLKVLNIAFNMFHKLENYTFLWKNFLIKRVFILKVVRELI